ncbi:MAG: hypothetical protein IKQ71_05860 [Lachnospiraceae bacterium]|nr:hypothetical protein [Lachnospiraceae bacterium]
MASTISGDWDYRTLPNRLFELVRNLGNMEQEGTGFFMESESEMITILNYLNFGDDTNITEPMKDQIHKAIAEFSKRGLGVRDDADRYN